MPTLVELPIREISVEPASESGAGDLIYEHYLYYCEHGAEIPAVVVMVKDGRPVLVGGWAALRVAGDLGRDRVRAIVHPSTSPGERRALLGRTDVREVPWGLARDQSPYARTTIVLFFERQLDRPEREKLHQQLRSALRGESRDADPEYSSDKPAAVWQPVVPVEDVRWQQDLARVLFAWHRDVVPIVSFQGRSFSSYFPEQVTSRGTGASS